MEAVIDNPKPRAPKFIEGQEGFEEEVEKILHGDYAEEYFPLNFSSPVEFLEFFHPALKQGEIELDEWQKETLDLACKKGLYTKEFPFEFGLITCNGSGKDAFFIAGAALFLLLTLIRHRVVITTSSYTQMKNQTQNYLRFLGERVNLALAELGVCNQALLIKRDHIVSKITGGEIIMFVTDDPGRAEGYHPFPDYPKGEVTLIVNEAKTVSDEIFSHLRRCTYTRWLEVSSPGDTKGHFFKLIERARSWNEGYLPGRPFYRRITAYDCKHIPNSRIEAAKEELGESSPLFRSMYMAEFVSSSDEVIIPREMLEECIEANVKPRDDLNVEQWGIDFSGGNDEIAIYRLKGNKLRRMHTFHTRNTEEQANIIDGILTKHGAIDGSIYGDDGGVGQGIIDKLELLGWHLIRVRNQSQAIYKKLYANRGAEMYFTFRRLVEEKVINIDPEDKILIRQLTTRRFAQHITSGKMGLEGKKRARASGSGSPDRADAAVLACFGINIKDLQQGKTTKQVSSVQSQRYTEKFLLEHQLKEDKLLQSLPQESTQLMRYGDYFVLPANNRVQKKRTAFNPIAILSNLT